MKNKDIIRIVIVVLAGILAGFVSSARAADYTHIWIDQTTGSNKPDTPGTPDKPFKSITYALARADYLGWPEPWHVHIGPGVYDANSLKPGSEREIFPIVLRQNMIFEGGDCSDPNNRTVDPNVRIIDGCHLIQGLCPILLGQDLINVQIRCLTLRKMYHNGNGGAVELVNCAGKIENCIIQNNSVPYYGGGLWLSPRSGSPPPSFHIIGCMFIGNTATNGGGFYVNGDIIGDISDCNFTDNSTSASGDYDYLTSHGGGFFVAGTVRGNINNCSFIRNSTFASGHRGTASHGGGFYIAETVSGSITGCCFTNNSTSASASPPWPDEVWSQGGGFYVGGTVSGWISNCNFTSNSTSASGRYDVRSYGGGFYVNGSLNGDITGCSFTNNMAGSGPEYGDSFYLVNVFSGNIEACQFLQSRNAIWLRDNSSTPVTIRSCLFVASELLADIDGWAIWTNQKAIMSNNTIVGPGLGVPSVPYKPSAIYIVFNTQAENGQIFNNIIVDSQCAIHVDAAVDMPIRYNCFDNVNEIVCQGEQCLGNDCWWLEWNLSNFRYNYCNTDPLFVAGDPMYHIYGNSPCVDAGDPNYVPETGEADIDGNCRDVNGVDIGADEVCVPTGYRYYYDWVTLRRPDCWCKCYQCDGDADNLTQGILKYRIYTNDFNILVANWKMLINDPALNPCADFDHKPQGVLKFRVYTNDFNILVVNWKKTDAQLPGNCPRPE
jgi:hypothetical protein